MKWNVWSYLVLILMIKLAYSEKCKCEDTRKNVEMKQKTNFLKSYAVMNLDHLYYGVPFFSSGNQVYFHNSQDYPCKCKKIKNAKMLSKKLVSKFEKKMKKAEKNQTIVEKNVKNDENHLEKLEEIFLGEKNQSKKNDDEIETDSSDKSLKNKGIEKKYLNRIDKYYNNIIEDSQNKFFKVINTSK